VKSGLRVPQRVLILTLFSLVRGYAVTLGDFAWKRPVFTLKIAYFTKKAKILYLKKA
jgi:hypothetical protein